jgi:hypothetical protein
VVKLAGTETMSGVLAALECDGRGIVIAFKTGDNKLLRFSVGDPSKLMFYSRNPEQKLNIGCGPINKPAFIHYAPAAAGQARFAGDAVAVEFK